MTRSTNEVFWRDKFTAENQKRIAYLLAVEELRCEAMDNLQAVCSKGHDPITGEIICVVPNKNSMDYTEYSAWKRIADDLEALAKLA